MPRLISQYAIILSRIVLPLIIAAVVFQIDLDYFESYLYDYRARSFTRQTVSDHIVLVSIKYPFIQKHKGLPTLDQYTQVLQAIHQGQPLAVVSSDEPQEFAATPETITEHIRTTHRIPHYYVSVVQLPLKGESQTITLESPFQEVPVFPGPWTRDSGVFAMDGVTRRALFSYEDQLMLHPYLAALIHPEVADIKNLSGEFEFVRSQQIYINYAEPDAYPEILFSDVLEGRADLSQFKDRIVIIGSDLNLNAKKLVYTPLSRDRNKMLPIHELHANMIDTFLNNNSPIRITGFVNFLLVALFCLLTVYVVLAMRPGRGLLTLAVSIFVFSSGSFLAFYIGYWVEMAQVLLAVFICYYLVIPYRLIMENRKSWEYLEKNRILMEVEELKSNFISMMSHDLKTPLARIRGMADVIGNDKSTTLSSDQQEAVNTIRNSSDDLTELINSILNFGRIESESVQLQYKNADLNAIIEEVANKKDYFAKQKDIELRLELEPLFSIKLDTELIRQVFANLVENAIKYSPSGSKILISTEEDDGHVLVQVADQGQGIPTEELDKIFLKFFRSKDANTSKVKGSGLGLYLSKYFVELHGGEIQVDSTEGQGTTFSVFLPIQ